MTEVSWFWDGKLTGDANQSPYTETEFAKVFSTLLGNDEADGFVVPNILNELNVGIASSTTRSVIVSTGEAFVKGFRYRNTSTVTLSFSANSTGNPRIDRVVLRIDWSAQTVRLVVVEGSDAVNPQLPGLTQTWGTTWEVPLAWVYCADSFTQIAYQDIHDERKMLLTSYAQKLLFSQRNQLKNSEFLALGHDTSDNYSVPYWAANNYVTVSAEDQPSGVSPRSRVLQHSRASTATFAQVIKVKPGEKYTLVANVRPQDGGTSYVGVTIDDTDYEREINQETVAGTPKWFTETIRFEAGEDDEITVYFRSDSNGNVTHIAQAVLVEGSVAGHFEPVHEVILFSQELCQDATWSAGNLLTYNTYTGSLDLSSDFGGDAISVACRAIIVRVEIEDSLSSGSSNAVYFGFLAANGGDPIGRVHVELMTNSSPRCSQMIVPLRAGLAYWEQLSGGEDTTTDSLTVTLDIVGAIT